MRRGHHSFAFCVLATFAYGMLSSSVASAEPAQTKLFTFHIGVNAAPQESGLDELRYADDDAARFHSFTKRTAEESYIAVVLDAQSLERHPGIAATAIVPRKAEIERALTRLHQKMATARNSGFHTELLFSYSGHGQPGEGGTLLTALDQSLSPMWLEEWVLKAPADRIHVFIDACHGAGVVEQRGLKLTEKEGTTIDVTKSAQVVAADVLRAYPHVGMLIASPKGVSAHEWSRLEAGVFTHEVLSALSGAADINGDQRITYSEVSSFIAAANRKVSDPRARIRAISIAPKINPGAAIIALDRFSDTAILVGRTTAFGHAWIESASGVRLLDMHPLPRSFVRILVPAESIFLLTDESEVKLALVADQEVDLQKVALLPRSDEVKARGSVAEALHAGLFQAPFERSYYKGYVDSEGLSSVSFTDAPDEMVTMADAPADVPSVSQVPGEESSWLLPGVLLAGAGIGVATTAMLAAVAGMSFYVADASPYARPAQEASILYVVTAVSALAVGVVTLGVGSAGILLIPTSEE